MKIDAVEWIKRDEVYIVGHPASRGGKYTLDDEWRCDE